MMCCARNVAITIVTLSLLTACGEQTSRREHSRPTYFSGPENIYYEGLKALVAALEYSTENAPGETLTITHQLQIALANSDEEDITGYEDEITRMTGLANELEQLYSADAGADETTLKVAELVAITNSLPGLKMPHDALYEFPERGDE